jgi:REP element-mobilizing transposase RayT
MTRTFAAMEGAIRRASSDAFRIVHFSVQRDHVHLIIEAKDRAAGIRGMRGLPIRAALALNRALGRSGRVWSDRYHARELKTPREVRNAIAYVLLNRRKHDAQAPLGVDPCSSGPWFDGWRRSRRPPSGCPPVAAPRTWLATVGWRRGGLLRDDERPGVRPTLRRRLR